MKVVIVGGVAGGASAAARIRRLDEHAQIIMIERSGYVSYANCGLPYPRNGRNALSEGLLQMGRKEGIPQLRTYGSAHLCHSSKRYPCASQCTIHADRHYGSDTSPPHSGGVP